MSGERALPERASLRYLKIAAKRRHAAGEFATLHEAQLAVARENGQPSWAALSRAVAAQDAASGREGHALTQLRWVVARFREAGQPDWAAPDEDELRAHFTGEFLAAVPPDRLVTMITELAPVLRGELVVAGDTPFTTQGRLGWHLVAATTEARSPYRLTSVRARALGAEISDPRAAAAPAASAGTVPGAVPAIAEAARSRFGMVGLVVAGASVPLTTAPLTTEPLTTEPWAAATGWASLEDGEPVGPGHAFPAYEVTMAVTAVAVLRLAAAGRLRLDAPASSCLTTVRLEDDAVTIRELLTHAGGVSDPPRRHAPAVSALAAVAGPVVACGGRRGTFDRSHAGYAVLGELVAASSGTDYASAVTRLVLEPLGMGGSWFPSRWPGEPGPGPVPAVTGYDVAAGDTFRPAERVVCVFAAAGGLWTTAGDLVRFGLGWPSLLPPSLAAQAVRPHVPQPNGMQAGLGWMVNESAGLTGLIGDGPGGAASLLVANGGRRAVAALTNRQIAVEPVSAAALGVFDRRGRG